MSDTDLTDDEAQRLSALLHRAADGLPPAAPAPATRRHPGRWLAAAAAVAALVVGGVVLLRGDGGERIATGPARSVDPRLATVVEQSGIWRLPEGLDDLRVVGASEIGTAEPTRFLVDDVERPTRWVVLAVSSAPLPAADESEVVDLGDGVRLSIAGPADGDPGAFSMWIDGGTPSLSGHFSGVDRDQVIELLRTSFGDPATLTDPERLRQALATVPGIDGLEPTPWDSSVQLPLGPEPAGSGPVVALELSLLADDGDEVAVFLQRTGLPPGVAMLNTRLEFDRIEQLGTFPDMSVRERPDLGPHVLERRWDRADPSGRQIIVFSDDGTMLSASRAVSSDEAAEAVPLTEAEQLRILGSLRAMDQRSFQSTLAAAGIELTTAAGGDLVARSDTGDSTATTLQGAGG